MQDLGSLWAIIGRSPVFSSLQASQCGRLISVMRERQIPEGATLYRQGQQGDALAIVVEGRLGIRLDQGDDRRRLTSIGPGQLVGEMSCLDPACRSATVMAELKTRLLELDRRLFLLLESEAPDLAAALVRGILRTVYDRTLEVDGLVAERLGHRLAPAGPGAEPPVRATSRPADHRHQDDLDVLRSEDVAVLQSAGSPVCWAAGETVCRQGAPARETWLVLEGEVEVHKDYTTGSRYLATRGPGRFVSDAAFSARRPHRDTCRTARPTRAIRFDREVHDRLETASSPLALRFLEQKAISAIRYLRILNRRLATLQAWEQQGLPDQISLDPDHTSGLTWDDPELDQCEVVVPEGLQDRRGGKKGDA